MIQNITSAFYKEVLNRGFLKILHTVEYINKQNIAINYCYTDINKNHTITINNSTGIELGYFTLGQNINTFTLNISVDEEYQHKGLSRVMIAAMILYLETETNLNIRYDQLLFIDTDASWNNEGTSFWDSIGMTECRFNKPERVSMRKMPFDGAGYEKKITYRKLSSWAFTIDL